MLAAAGGVRWDRTEVFYQIFRQNPLVLVVCRGFEGTLHTHVAFPVAILNCQLCKWLFFMLLRKAVRIAETFYNSSQLMYFLSFLLWSCYKVAFEFPGRLIRTLGLSGQASRTPAPRCEGWQENTIQSVWSSSLVFTWWLLFSAGGCFVCVLQLLFEVLKMLFIFAAGCTVSPTTEGGLILPLQMIRCVSKSWCVRGSSRQLCRCAQSHRDLQFWILKTYFSLLAL